MKYDLNEFYKLEEAGYLRSTTKEDLILFTYTDLCTYERYWNEYTRAARGLILNKNTGEVVAKPFDKFFNLGEMPETQLLNLPNESYTVSEKVDGSLGILFHYKNEWHIATRGSFSSEQAIKGLEILKQYDLSNLKSHVTLLVEIIYPANKIVVDYKEEKLVALGAFNRETGDEILVSYLDVIWKSTLIHPTKTYKYTIDQMIQLQKTIPKDQEGFVIRFENGLRVKIKGDEYCKIHKIISNLSPISFWEAMENGEIPKEYLMQIPEEFKKDFEPIVYSLQMQYNKVFNEVREDFNKLPVKEGTPENRKIVGLFLKDSGLKHSQAMFPLLLGNVNALDGYIMKYIRPKGNEIKENI